MRLAHRLFIPTLLVFTSTLNAASLRFHGSGTGDIDRVKISIDAPPRPADVGFDFTLEWWMKAILTENNTAPCTPGPLAVDAWRNGNVMFDRDVLGTADYGDYGVAIFGGRVAFGVAVGSSGQTLCGPVNVADNAWHHLAVTRNATSGQIAIFVDGIADGTTSGPPGDISYHDGRAGDANDPFLVIGAEKRDAAPGRAYSGWIDEVRLSNVIRYPGAYSRPRQPFFTDASTVMLMHFDELSGDTIHDESGAAGGPSNGIRKFGGTVPGPVWSTESAPFIMPAANNLAISPVTTGLTRPLGVVHAGDGSGRIFFVQQTGQIRIWNGTQILATPFLDISSQVLYDGGERGLLGLAFHPQYATNGFFYVYYTRSLNSDGWITVSRYHVSANPNVADPLETVLLTIDHHQFGNHNGGDLQFGPDGYLYLGTGDGGGGGDTLLNGQNLNALLAKILRIDVNTVPYSIPPDNPFVGVPNRKPEIWAYGVRNPWRFSFDRLTGDLYIGDVGQSAWEEVDFQRAGIAGGQNYGWNVLEGAHCYNNNAQCSAFLSGSSVLPVLEYDHNSGDCAIVGGYVFRGRPNSFVAGNYFYGDECSGRIWRGIPDGTGAWTSLQAFDTTFNISSFGEDEKKNLYFVDVIGGSFQRLTPYTFTDVTPAYPAWTWIESIVGAGITAGCTATNYCPDATITRAQMAIFLLRAKHSQTYLPPPATGTVFTDVPIGSAAADWIEELYAEGITGGCGGGRFCPGDPVRRDQMAVFLLRAHDGSSYAPPPCTGLFTDVPCGSYFAPFIEELFHRGITAGCGGGNYCPANPVTRANMAIFVSKTFNLPTP